MIATEISKNDTTVRIHDEFCESASEKRMQQLNQIVSEHYKQKYVNNYQDSKSRYDG